MNNHLIDDNKKHKHISQSQELSMQLLKDHKNRKQFLKSRSNRFLPEVTDNEKVMPKNSSNLFGLTNVNNVK